MASGELGQDNIRRALKGFAEVLDLEIDGYSAAIRDAIENGRIQKFEYYSELFWKYVRSCLQSEGKEVPNSPRGTLKESLARGFLHEAEYAAGMQIYVDRNACSHIYRQEIMPLILGRLPTHLALMQAVLDRVPAAETD
ncbi:MAG: nucleotidyltransferase substrate binding protein [Planctomycetia bacterium]|nr:nucleotidyltransferase substrate binding protein [Planctomycetia bacterium]